MIRPRSSVLKTWKRAVAALNLVAWVVLWWPTLAALLALIYFFEEYAEGVRMAWRDTRKDWS